MFPFSKNFLGTSTQPVQNRRWDTTKLTTFSIPVPILDEDTFLKIVSTFGYQFESMKFRNPMWFLISDIERHVLRTFSRSEHVPCVSRIASNNGHACISLSYSIPTHALSLCLTSDQRTESPCRVDNNPGQLFGITGF
jgi:hypothetical protein